MKFKPRLIDLKESGWYEFSRWAMMSGFSPEDFLDDKKREELILEYRSWRAQQKIYQDIERDMFSGSVTNMKPGQVVETMLGVAAQIEQINKDETYND